MKQVPIARSTGALVLLLAVGLPACASKAVRAQAPPVSETPPLPTDSALILIRQLETEPLAEGSSETRNTLFDWLKRSPTLAGIELDSRPAERPESEPYQYSGELFIQYLLGNGAWYATNRDTSSDRVEQQLAGLRSMIAAYRSLVRNGAAAHDPFLDRLDDLRRRGALRNYIIEQRGRERP